MTAFVHSAEQLTELHGSVPRLRELIEDDLRRRVGDAALTFDFHRLWNGGWRARVDVAGKGRLEFVLFRTSSEALLAVPNPMPARWHGEPGFMASDGSRWTITEDGDVCCLAVATDQSE